MMLSVIMLSAVMLNILTLNVVAPFITLSGEKLFLPGEYFPEDSSVVLVLSTVSK
jgi:hypothetical protein